jgi:hypothetical protein
MDQRVTFSGPGPNWEAVNRLLADHGMPVQMRMIDGELSFPDESPPESWRELRVGTAAGMVTLRREASAITCVIWGNADAALRQLWNALAWALAEVGGGRVQTTAGPVDAAAYRTQAELPESFRGPPQSRP